MRLFFLPIENGQPPAVGDTVELDAEQSHHLLTVLRGGRESQFQLTDGTGRLYTGRLATRASGEAHMAVNGRRQSAAVTIESVRELTVETARPHLIVACGVVKGRRFEWMLEKAVEMGAHRIVPLLTDRGVVTPGGGKQQRWRTILVSAVKQAGRAWLPILEPAVGLADFLNRPPDGPVYFGAVDSARDWADVLRDVPANAPPHLTVLIGPEGGWSASERTLLDGSIAQPWRLGPFILRTETAAVAGLMALQTLRRRYS